MNRSLLLLRFLLKAPGKKRGDFLKINKIFHSVGENVFYYSNLLPSEPYLVSIGNNVKISANVRFITHDVIQTMLNNARFYKVRKENLFYMGKIEILDNVMIGANSIILYDIKIGSNVIIAAGSVVTKDIPTGIIVGGNPAREIGKVNELALKRYEIMKDRPNNHDKMEKINKYFWNIDSSY
ncbi:MAG: hypothetical protein K0R54_4267 [Clostridiaceae bacterium]|jgi:acetyltransferase-like isoleucine patch superfamily enzyme|nr:hypothetical protein [Clostridiaceae bacterium]